VIFSKKDIQDNINHLDFMMVLFSPDKQDENKTGDSTLLLCMEIIRQKKFCNAYGTCIFHLRIDGINFSIR